MSIVRTLFKKIITSWINKYRLYCRKRDWRNHALNNISNTVLTKEQKVQIQKYFAPYTKVNSIFHEFYTQKTDDFFVNYIPCDIYFAYDRLSKYHKEYGELLAAVALGYPDENPTKRPRNAFKDVVSYLK